MFHITNRGHGDSVDQLVWHPSDPDMLATASGDRTVRIWDARLSKAVANIATKVNYLTAGNFGSWKYHEIGSFFSYVVIIYYIGRKY